MVYFSKLKVGIIVSLAVFGIATALPNFFTLPGVWGQKKLNLGLDLKGGAYLLLEVETDKVLAERGDALVDTVRQSLRQRKIGYTGLGSASGKAVFTLTDPSKTTEAISLLRRELPTMLVEARENGKMVVSYGDEGRRQLLKNVMEQSVEIVRLRVDATGTSEPDIRISGGNRIIVALPGEDPERIKQLLGKTAKLTMHFLGGTLALAEKQGKLPPGTFLLAAKDPVAGEAEYILKRKVAISGERLEQANATFDSQSAAYVVSISFDGLGARQFARVTKDNVGKRLAIVLDGQVLSAPVINEPIPGGVAQISGSFTAAEASDLALLLSAGALPAPLTILEERSVGPGIGKDSVEAGKSAAIFGFILVVLFMGFYYRSLGILADVALLLNLVLLLGLLSLLQATLTLPGIAGIVLTLGMAVDANVLVFERIREERALGRTLVNAVAKGYERALRTIIDANLTTLIAAMFLYIFGSGAIRGFAVTLSLGLVTSLFTATMVTRLLVVIVLRRSPKLLGV